MSVTRMSRARLDAEATWADLNRPPSGMRWRRPYETGHYVITGPDDQHIRTIPDVAETQIQRHASGDGWLIPHPNHPLLWLRDDDTAEEVKP